MAEDGEITALEKAVLPEPEQADSWPATSAGQGPEPPGMDERSARLEVILIDRFYQSNHKCCSCQTHSMRLVPELANVVSQIIKQASRIRPGPLIYDSACQLHIAAHHARPLRCARWLLAPAASRPSGVSAAHSCPSIKASRDGEHPQGDADQDQARVHARGSQRR